MNGEKKLCEAFISVVHIVERLRGPQGCPWDAKQTEDTVKNYLIEEAYEVLDAIQKRNYQEICEELGDLIFMIIFLTRIATEKNKFTLLDVLEGITNKMIRRHPHVFGNQKVKDAEEVVDNWAKIKMKEKKYSDEDILNRTPLSLPSLLRAQKISEKAASFGFDWKNKEDIWNKVKEEFSELEDAIKEGDKNKVEEEIGDLIFSLVNLSRHWNLNAEEILRNTNKKFISRFNKMVKLLKEEGIDIKEAKIDKMDEVWNKIKKDD